MGATDSRERLGEKVIAARKKLLEQTELQSDRFKFFENRSPETINVIIDSIDKSFGTCSPFLEHTLLIAWKSDPSKCAKIIVDACKKVLSAPILADEYKWFQQYVLPSSIWFYKVNDISNKYMFEELLNIVDNMSSEIITSMNSIYSLFQSHPKWNELLNIENETFISRQDHKNVGLLKQNGITNIIDLKQDEKSNTDSNGSIEEMKTFIDSNLAVNILTTTAKQINNEFQNHMNSVMSHYGTVKEGPIKKVERCQSKLENDYQNEQFPQSAKLLDLVRCSVTFNTLDQLLNGYNGLMNHINKHPSMSELARIKNGFLDADYRGGYRDIKINIVYHSSINVGVSMICEVQLLLLNYLHEKKRIHKLYSIARNELYFQMVVKQEQNANNNSIKDMKNLKFVPVLKVNDNIKMKNNASWFGKCSFDTNSRLLGMENDKWFTCLDMVSKEAIFEQKLSLDKKARNAHNWIVKNDQKYLTLATSLNTIKMFKVLERNKKFEFEEDKALQICYGEKDVIIFCEFDKYFENMFTVLNGNIFEQRAMNNVTKIKARIKLESEVEKSNLKEMSVSGDGTLCVIAGGPSKNYFYIIDIENKSQYKLTSNVMRYTCNPRFINDEKKYVAVAGTDNDDYSKVEIWDISKRTRIRIIDIGQQRKKWVWSMTATNNILAVGTSDKTLRLYDVRTWEIFFCDNVDIGPQHLTLAADFKYLTIGGSGQNKCVVLEIR